MIDKNNRKLKGTDSNLSARRLMFERVRALWSEQRGVWCAVDFEAWDMDHRVITEFGWSTLRWVGGEPVEDMGHLIVGKHRGYTNHFVPENRRVSWPIVSSSYPDFANVVCQFYDFGQSEDVTMKQLKERIHNMIQSMAIPGPLFLVFHDNSQDIKYLRSPEINAPLDGLSFFLPEYCTEVETSDTPKVYVVDTSELFAALEGDSGGQKRSLERVCRLLQIKSTFTQHMHNAGNDARVSDSSSSLPRTLKNKMIVHILGPQRIGWWGSARHATGYTLAAAHKQQHWPACRVLQGRRGQRLASV
jgi:hypothetical protein